jgi:hypothetical protein
MMEGLSYIAGTEIPAVLIDIVAAAPAWGISLHLKAITTRSSTVAGTAITIRLSWRLPVCRKRLT